MAAPTEQTLADRLVAEWTSRDRPSPHVIERWSRRTEGVEILPKSTVHGWLHERKLPREWSQLLALLRFLDVEDPDAWRPLWQQATSGGPRPAARTRRVPRSRLAVAAVAVLLAAGGVTWWLTTGGDAPCHEVAQYRVTAEGNVVDQDGKGFEKVLPGQRFRHDPARTDVRTIEGRLYGTVVGTDVTGYVRTHKLEFEEQTPRC